LERANKFYFHSIATGENGFRHSMNKGTNWCTYQHENNLENFLENKTKKLSTQPKDNLEIQVIHLRAQTKDVQVEVMHLKPNHLCMQE